MKKRYFSSILLAMLVASGYAQSSALGNQMTAQERSKLNIALLAKVNDLSIQQAAAKKARAKAGTQAEESEVQDPRISILVEVAEDADPVSVLQQHGVEATAHVFQFAEAKVSLEQLKVLAADSQVKEIELSRKLRTYLDKANQESGVARIHQGDGLSSPYTGKGVLALVGDVGFYPAHPMFKDSEGGNKIEYLRGSDGEKYTTQADIEAYKSTLATHGTSVASVLAGSAVTDVDQISYEGVAPGAKLALFDSGLDDTAQDLKSIQDLQEYAAAHEDRPIVINFSVGYNSTALSDGTDIYSKIIGKLAERWPVCVSVGDYAHNANALYLPCTAEKKEAAVYLRIPNWVNESMIPEEGDFYFSSDSQRPFKAKLLLDNGQYTAGDVVAQFEIPTDLDGKQMIVTSNESDGSQEGTVYSEELAKLQPKASIAYTSSLVNGKYAVSIKLLHFDPRTNGQMALILEGEEGQILYGTGFEDNYNSYLEAMNSDTEAFMTADGLVNEWAMAPGVIAVGCYNTYRSSASWGDLNDLISTSSYSTHSSADKMLPMVCAPGHALMSANNKWYEDEWSTVTAIEGSEDGLVRGLGTSMSTAYMSGIIALWLEANPQLTPAEVKDIIAKTARKDEYVTSASEPARWGYGKVDAYAGLKEALNRTATSLGSISQDKDFLWRMSGNQLEAYVAGETALTARLINMEGKVIAEARQSGNTISLTAPQATKGVYVLQVQGEGKGASHTAKVVMR